MRVPDFAGVSTEKFYELCLAALDVVKKYGGDCSLKLEFDDGRPPLTVEARVGDGLGEVMQRTAAKMIKAEG